MRKGVMEIPLWKSTLHVLFINAIFCFAFIIMPHVNAETMTGRASVARQAIMDTSYNYIYSDWKLLSDNSLNAIPFPTDKGNNFYIMGAEYSFPISLTGQTDFVATVRIPVADNTIYTYQLMDGLNQYDFRAGVDHDFAVYNVIPDIQLFNHVCDVFVSQYQVAHTYCYYDITFSFNLTTPVTGAYNLNFALLNTTSSRSTYYYSGGSAGVAYEFPTGYFTQQSWDYSVMSPTVKLTTGTTANNQDIIDNQNANTQEVIETIQENYENLVKSQEVCSFYDKSDIYDDNKLLHNSSVESHSSFGITNFINIDNATIEVLQSADNGYASACFYDLNKTVISCLSLSNLSLGYVSIPSNAIYFRTSISKNINRPQFQVCRNGNQAIKDTLTDSNIDIHSTQSFFDNIEFYDESTLSAVITAPIDFINSLDDACTPVVLTYRGQSITLPCGNDIFWDRQDVCSFRALWNALFGGLIIYRLVRKLLQVVNDALDPTKDSLGGFDL